MPLWQIYHPPTTFSTPESKQSFAKDITKFYTDLGLPAFYVVVNFIQTHPGNVFVGGTTKHPTDDKPFVRIVITHIALHVPDSDAAYLSTTTRLDQAMKPHLLDKGYDFEYDVDETDRRLWKINGLVPPPFKSEEERVWVRENRAVEY
ncbi:putative oxalocrotonate tautomerase [Aspergillus welwitschiae]|uniref:Putative oxalocrotonate tautomerase n=1 Tax=Aspergillus welwitschiae TaxID=1341132 RepID=A0A3F3QB79_9EURO|nr:putative oxalocrotonate tautomerase [Aspergillus welwitschiae]RDH36398.1 putative oxalocrotonate tautomerase [Aspergillus welwitschiae]